MSSPEKAKVKGGVIAMFVEACTELLCYRTEYQRTLAKKYCQVPTVRALGSEVQVGSAYHSRRIQLPTEPRRPDYLLRIIILTYCTDCLMGVKRGGRFHAAPSDLVSHLNIWTARKGG